MLLDLEHLVRKHHLRVGGVLHAGAHLGEEAELYDRLFPGAPVWWIEANPGVLTKIERNISRYRPQQLIHALLWSEDGRMVDFHVTNYDGMSSSVLAFGTHPEFSPDTVFTHDVTVPSTKLDTLVDEYGIEGVNFLNMDLQGVELQCLQGAEKFLEQIDYINTEVNTADVYVGCTKLDELDEHLQDRGFRRVDTHMVPGQGWGDAFYMRTIARSWHE